MSYLFPRHKIDGVIYTVITKITLQVHIIPLFHPSVIINFLFITSTTAAHIHLDQLHIWIHDHRNMQFKFELVQV